MNLLKLEKRDLDWWLFTLFPIFMLLIALLFGFLFKRQDIKNSILIFEQQLLVFCIVLYVTDIGLKAKKKLANTAIGIPLYLLITSLVGLILGYSIENTLIRKTIWLLVFLAISLMFTYFAILLQNRNPYSNPIGEVGAKEIMERKEEYEEAKRIELLSPLESDAYEDVKFGEHNE
jgi:hypothetical protein